MSMLKWGLIDQSGSMVVPCRYDFLWWPSAAGILPVRVDQSWTFRRLDGSLAFEGIFEDAFTHKDGRAAVKQQGRCGLIDEQGVPVRPFEYDSCATLSDGMSAVARGERYGYIDRDSQLVIPCEFSYANAFSEGLAAVCLDDSQWTFVGKNGQFATENRFDEISNLSEGLAYATADSGAGYVDQTGKFKLKATHWGSGSDFSEGLASVTFWDREEFKRGYLNCEGETVIPPSFDFAGFFRHGRACVGIEDRYGVIDRSGNFVVEPRFSDTFHFNEGFAAVSDDANSRFGFIGLNGEQLIPPKFAHASAFRNGYARVATQS